MTTTVHTTNRTAALPSHGNVVMRYAPFADEPMADHDPVEIVEWFEAAVGKEAAQRKAQRQAQHD